MVRAFSRHPSQLAGEVMTYCKRCGKVMIIHREMLAVNRSVDGLHALLLGIEMVPQT
jgi:hypothetical protein